MKMSITINVLIFSTVGAWLGALPDHGNGLGGWSIIGGTLGGFLGIWVGYKIGKYYF